MRSKFTCLLTLLIVIVSASFTATLRAQCCRIPDSLKVKSVTDSSFCVQFNKDSIRTDTSSCDTARSYELQWKLNADTLHPWNDTIKRYNGKTTITFCDTASPCTKYQWRIRNLCIKGHDTTRSSWITGPRINTTCDTGHFVRNHHMDQSTLRNAQIIPNPAHDRIVISGNVTGIVQINISNFQGKEVMVKSVTVTNDKLNTVLNVGSLQNGIYFVTIVSKANSTKLTFMKQ